MRGRIFWNDVSINVLAFPVAFFSVGFLLGMLPLVFTQQVPRPEASSDIDADVAFSTSLVFFWVACYIWAFASLQQEGETLLASAVLGLFLSLLILLYGAFFVFLPVMAAFVGGFFLAKLLKQRKRS